MPVQPERLAPWKLDVGNLAELRIFFRLRRRERMPALLKGFGESRAWGKASVPLTMNELVKALGRRQAKTFLRHLATLITQAGEVAAAQF